MCVYYAQAIAKEDSRDTSSSSSSARSKVALEDMTNKMVDDQGIVHRLCIELLFLCCRIFTENMFSFT